VSSHFPGVGAVAYLIHSVEIISYRARCHITQVLLKNIEESLQKSKDEDRVHCHALSPKLLARKRKRTHCLLSQDMRYECFRGLRDNMQTVLRMNRRTRPDRRYARGSYQMHRLGRLCVEARTRHEMYETRTGSVVACSETGLLRVSRAGGRLYYPEASNMIIPSIVMVASCQEYTLRMTLNDRVKVAKSKIRATE
jgi:hypothetical protein